MDIDKIKENVVVDDGHILLGKPLSLLKYGKKIEIKPLNWFYEWDDYSYCLMVWLNYYNIIVDKLKLPDKLEDLGEFRRSIKMTMGQKEAFIQMEKICGFAGLKKRWMRKRFTADDYIEIFIYMYLYNIMGLKKNLSIGLNLIKATKH